MKTGNNQKFKVIDFFYFREVRMNYDLMPTKNKELVLNKTIVIPKI